MIVDTLSVGRENQEKTLSLFWQYLKEDGMYVIENVDSQRGGLDFKENPVMLSKSTQDIFLNNHVTFIDTSIGHRNWTAWSSKMTSEFVKNHRYHNSYLLVMRKRVGGSCTTGEDQHCRGCYEGSKNRAKLSFE